ncbi:hypothetical protein [Gaetbulibacter jejuensis]|uniref:hypothetical protein n=1 Tax=Gaetbulibacter jejuensis TaxID=584607 RepID=UPI00300A1066
MRTNVNTFLARAKEVHGDKYDYSKVDYQTTEKKVIIICKEHGEFLMRPRAHYADKRGCPNCDKTGKSGFHKSPWYEKTKRLYLIEFSGNGERFLKFGVTSNKVEERIIKGQILYQYKILFDEKFSDGEKAIEIEKKLKSKYLKIPYVPEMSFRGSSECLEFGIKEHLLKDLKRIMNKKTSG